ncbi:MAG: GTPase ObgE [Anaerococcus vaginalis]|uniref:GTPase ObgE n=1 Tax=Anaerococcus vaginalis TaxID=33037 RepID=UPI00242FD3C8|nr:GTPase ObgE [Anaerococcus vaginalis]MBS6920355.1 GTPase ObgE [Anaerococcus vaginalis]
MIDYAKIELQAGKGGDGAVAFRREKYEPTGGPAGGDGGDGASIYIKATNSLSTLEEYRYKTKYKATNGEDGMGKKRFGKKGEDLYLYVPVGTIVRESTSGKIIKDLKKNGEEFLIAKGGKGGKGNVHYKSSTRQAPRFAQKGKEGQKITISLELKILADVGLVGLPNVGKSTLISVISKAKPKIANYHFTTLDPNLGVVKIDKERSFIVADIPGLIEGANEGLGLGHDFLKHVQRCKILVHLVDISGFEGRDPIEDFELINKELKLFDENLYNKYQIVALNKSDLDFNENYKNFEEKYSDKYKIFRISAATTNGIKDLIDEVSRVLYNFEDEQYDLDEKVDETYLEEFYDRSIASDELNFEIEDGIYVCNGYRIDKLLEKVNLDDYDSRMYFEKNLREMGVFEKFVEMGIQEGDSVAIGDIVFDYYE